jgi:hypothetical protein
VSAPARIFLNWTKRPGGYQDRPAWDATGAHLRRYYVILTDPSGECWVGFSDDEWASVPLGTFPTMHDAAAAAERHEATL